MSKYLADQKKARVEMNGRVSERLEWFEGMRDHLSDTVCNARPASSDHMAAKWVKHLKNLCTSNTMHTFVIRVGIWKRECIHGLFNVVNLARMVHVPAAVRVKFC